MVYYPKPMHRQGAFVDKDSAVAYCPVTERLCRTVLSLPMHPYLNMDTVEIISNEIKNILK